MYDSLHKTIDEESIKLVTNTFGTEDSIFVCIPKMQIQTEDTECWLFAIAYMASLAYGDDPCHL